MISKSYSEITFWEGCMQCSLLVLERPCIAICLWPPYK